MKSLYFLALGIGASLALSLSSCQSVLDKSNLTAISDQLIYKDSTLASLNLNYVYDNNLPGWGGITNIGLGNVNTTGLTDESYNDNVYVKGTAQLTDVPDFGVALSASNNYGRIRFINMFLRDVKNGTIADKSKARLRAQAQFFRAWRYFDLVRLYGGVPLVYVPLDAVGPEARALDYLPRNSTSDCYKAIVADLDSAIAVLPAKWTTSTDWGRITKGAAAAFKSRVLLTQASPQFNPNDDAAKWKAANDASVQAVTLLTAGGFALHASYDQMWFQEVNNPEAVMITGFNTSTGDNTKKNNTYDNATRPSYTGTSGGSNAPVWEMVQAYPMLDGLTRGTSTKYAYTDQFFYKNRDPRFDKTIAYNGCIWPLNGNTNYHLWTYYIAGKTVETKASSTGFYCRKAINPTAGISDAAYIGTDWIEIRYAEVLLNLAETACGVNDLTTAYDQLKLIRKRAGLEAGTNGYYGLQTGMTRTQMFDAILFERQIEFAFEGKRFWDLRRWKKLESVMNTAVKRRNGQVITLLASVNAATFLTLRDGLTTDQAYTTYFAPFATTNASSNTTSYLKQLDAYDINYKPTYYFFGIPQTAIDNNPNILQNNTWGGTFDPLK
ncbi:MAG: RagB/SusD family nutrient uptake outer membrane protein [Janthinobacterium lividum]